MEIVHGRKVLSRIYMKKSRKFATAQENKLVLALLEQNKRVTNDLCMKKKKKKNVESISDVVATRVSLEKLCLSNFLSN